MAYDNNMTGALFKNKKKETEKHPDYNGSCEIDNVEYWISAWVKESSKTGEKFFSFAFNRKDNQGQNKVQSAATVAEDDVPF